MKKITAILLTPFGLIALVILVILAIIGFILLLPIIGIIYALTAIVTAFFVMLAIVFGVYYFLKDTGEPFQRTSSNNYSLSDEKEMGKKEQKVN